MAPYPPPQPPPPQQTPRANGPLILLFVLAGLGFLALIGGAVTWLLIRNLDRAEARAAPAESSAPTAALPGVTRHVPHHATAVLDRCTQDDLRLLVDGIDGAISVGAPLYNAGNFAGCYHMYEGTAADLERRLSPACAEPARALEAGRKRAASIDDPSGQAWAMRDAFDGLLDVVERRRSGR